MKKKLAVIFSVLVAVLGLTWSGVAAQEPTPVVGTPVATTPTPDPAIVGERVDVPLPPVELPAIWGAVCRKPWFIPFVDSCDYPFFVSPIQGARVVATMTADCGTYQAGTYTDYLGRYVFDNLWGASCPGDYLVEPVKVAGCEGKFQWVTIDGDHDLVRVDFVCSPYPVFLPRIFR